MQRDCCAIGSTNRAKIMGAQRALVLLGIKELIPLEIDIGNPQPIGIDEILEGAIRRAEEAMKHRPECYGLGIEAGLIKLGGQYLSGQIAVFMDDQRYGVGVSMFFPIPRRIGMKLEKLRGRTELKNEMIAETGIRNIASTIGAVGYYTQGFITRTDLSYQAVLGAIIPWLNPDKYESAFK